ncbi:hypothetical protein H0H81_009891 [Sphagnurus paluster]|uniref:Uncharacterized protein n=1 Tax=Sphagnurus paluster TaxID=117069 RepID=A0A9P7KLG2_9AGAR|nr:hypothetical protein H0H81_009891 [Sphagnurus paluster]
MEPTAAFPTARDEVAARNRFESFKLGKGLPSNVAQKRSHTHARSHSRNASISSSISAPSLSTPLPSPLFKPATTTADMSPPLGPVPSSKRNSHHRRRSSVSTRIESAELMGVSIPDLPPSTSEDNINLGEKDSIRRRALWALEGKPDLSFAKVEIPELSSAVMEKMMFDLVSSKPSQVQNAVPSYGQSLNTLLSSKRDSFKLLGASSSSKDQLHTLVEEEEEDEDQGEETPKPQEVEPAPTTLVTPVMPIASVTKVTPARHRPATLNLRPLSLTPENLGSTTGLPTPSLTPSPRLGLKSLALVPSPTTEEAAPSPVPRRLSLTLNSTSDSPTPASTSFDEKASRRSSISYKSSASQGVATNLAGLPTPEMTPTSFDRRYSMSISDTLRRRSSSTSSSRHSMASSSVSGEDDLSCPAYPVQAPSLSASEQHFLFKSHNALLARITDLERALSVRRRSSGGVSLAGSSRPVSVASDFESGSEYAFSEPGDEMLRLVADLKAERDELKRDVDGWRTRVGDMEKQLGVVAGRVESERRDAWVARSMAGMLEIEKNALERKLGDVQKDLSALEEEKKALQVENCEVKQRVVSLEEELERLRQELFEERQTKRDAVILQQDNFSTPTPRAPEPRSRPMGFTRRGRAFPSVDSESSMTDVEDSFEESNPKFNFPLKAVVEDDEDVFSEEDNGLAGYEDAEDSDVDFHSSSSFDSEDNFPRSVAHLHSNAPSTPTTPRAASPAVPSVPIVHAPRPTHASRASLSKTWTFPKGTQSSQEVAQREPEVDRFFECLQDDEPDNSGSSAPSSPSAYSYEKSKNLFASGFKYGADDEDLPFFFALKQERQSPVGLGAVPEEEDEDEDEEKTPVDEQEDMFGEAGGIRITFTPPDVEEDDRTFKAQRSPSPPSAKPIIPIIRFFDADYEEEDSTEDVPPFNFGRPLEEEVVTQPVFSPPPPAPKPVEETPAPAPPVMITPPSSLPRSTLPRVTSPSSIPRATAIRNALSFADMPTSTPPRPTAARTVSSPDYPLNAFVTPPNKRGGVMPSFIPQLVSSPSPIRTVSNGAPASRPKGTGSSTTFIRQPQRKPLQLATNNMNGPKSGAAHVEPVMNTRSLPRSPDAHATTHATAQSAHAEMKSVDLSDHFSSNTNTSTMSSSRSWSSHSQNKNQKQHTPASTSPLFVTTTPTQTYPHSVRDLPFSPPQAGSAPLQSSSSFSALMSSPLSARLSFQTFTNFIPISWSQRASDAPSTRSFFDVASTSEISTTPVASIPLKRCFVSKEKQLEKLRNRMKSESMSKMRTSVSFWCNRCDEKGVTL